jgi:hypothetical protein
MKKLSLKMARIRHESDIQRMRTDIRHLQVKAGSLQRQTSTVIEEVRNDTDKKIFPSNTLDRV